MKKQSEYEQKYKEIELIGKGTQGQAYLIENKEDKKRYVSKKVILTNLSEKDQNNAIQELKLLREMKHPNIVKFIESYKEKNKIIIIMEYCECGDLSKYIKDKAESKEQIDENVIMQWLIQICQALTFIHSKKIIHRDIKSSNIFITKSQCLKIGDFGISKQLDHSLDQANTLVGTPYYLSPEVCQNKPYTFKTDMWSLGCVIYELCALKHPFYSNSLMSLVMKIASEKTPKTPPKYSKMLDGFIRSLLKKQPEKRPSANDLLNNQSIKKLMKEFVLAKENIVNDYQNMKHTLQKKGATQGEITLMEKQFQEKISKQQQQVRAQIQAQSSLQNSSQQTQNSSQKGNSSLNFNQNQSKNESSISSQNEQFKSSLNPSIQKQEQKISTIERNESEKKHQMNITQKERQIQEQLSYLQQEVRESYQRLKTPTTSERKRKGSMQDSGCTVRSELVCTSSSKKKKETQDIIYDDDDGEKTMQSILVSHFDNTNRQSAIKSKTSNSKRNDPLGSTVKSRQFIVEEDDENINSNGLGMSTSINQKQFDQQINESGQTETNSQFLTSSEGERESNEEGDDDEEEEEEIRKQSNFKSNRGQANSPNQQDDNDSQLSEQYSPSMALDLVQNESIILSKFVVKNLQTDINQEQRRLNGGPTKLSDQQLKLSVTNSKEQMNNESGIEEYSSNNAIVYGSKIPLPLCDSFSDTNISLNVSLTQDSVFLRSKLGLTGLSVINSKSNNLAEISYQNKNNNNKKQVMNLLGNTNNSLNIEELIGKQRDVLNSTELKHNQQSSEEYYEDDFEEYEDDFEEYKEEGEEEEQQEEKEVKHNTSNLTRVSQKFDCHFMYESDEEKYEDEFDQLDSILDLYKGQLGDGKTNPKSTNTAMSESMYQFDLTEIIEESFEHSTLYSQRSSRAFNIL